MADGAGRSQAYYVIRVGQVSLAYCTAAQAAEAYMLILHLFSKGWSRYNWLSKKPTNVKPTG